MVIKYTEEQLNSVDTSMLIHMFLNQQEQLEKVSADLHSLDTKMQAMMEQLILANKNRFGRSSEKMEDTQQMRFIEVDGTLVFFNEAEAVCDLDAPEPETLEAAPERKKKSKGKKAQDMSELSTNRIDHYMTEEELTAEFVKMAGNSFQMLLRAAIVSFRQKSKWMSMLVYMRAKRMDTW